MDELVRPYHPVADMFPLMQGEEYKQLKADIGANGLLEEIWLHPDASIIDGRNRHRVCIETETPMRFQTWDGRGSLVSFIVSMNLHRRHLTSSQRAAIALDILPMLEEEAKERQIRKPVHSVPELIPEQNGGGESREQAAVILNTNSRYVADAKTLKEKAPDLLEKVKIGEISIPQAKRELNHRSKVEPPPMKGRYRVIYADPPWAYDNSGFYESAEQHYPTMSTEDICALPVAELRDSPTVLYLWATAPLLPEALEVMKAWGFTYKTHRIWRKDKAPSIGWWGRTEHELLLVGAANGNLHPLEKLPSVVDEPVIKHSSKPESFRHDIELVHPGPYIELFAREANPRWETWGNESGVKQ